MPQPLINVGAAVGDGTGELGPRAWLQKLDRLPIPDNTVNPLSGDYSGTYEQKITAAIADGVATGKKYCWITQPYSASLVVFNNAIKMIREGGDPSTHDPQAYGALGNAVFVTRAAGAGLKATIAGQDDTVALQQCINAAAANLEVVLLPPNAYKITTNLTLPTNTQIIGSGWNTQICSDWFDGAGGASGGQGAIVNVDQVNGNSNIRLSNFYLNGAGNGSPTGFDLPNGVCAGIFFRGSSAACTDILIRDVKLTNTCGIAIAYQGCQRIQIINNLLHDLGADGITGSAFNAANLTDVLVEGNTIFSPGDDGIALLASVGTSGPDTTARPTRLVAANNVIRDVLVSNGRGRGIIVAGCEYVTVTGNVISNTFASGIDIQYDTIAGSSNFSSRYVAVTGNNVKDAGRTGNGTQPQIGIRLTGVQFCAVTGNVVDHAVANGIYLNDNSLAIGASNDIAISDNVVTNCGTVAASDTAVQLDCRFASDNLRRVLVCGNVVTNNQSGGIGVRSVNHAELIGNQCTNNGLIGGHSGAEAGIWLASAGGLTCTCTVRGNYCTDTQGTRTQTSGVVFHNLGTAVTHATIQDNYLKTNFNNGTPGEVLFNLAPTALIYRRDDTTPFTLTDAATVAINATAGAAYLLTCNVAGATRAMGAPTNPSLGQRIHFTIIQDGTGGRAVTWNAVYKVTWADTGNTLNKRSTIAFIYDGTNWNQDGAQTPYV